jgi:nitrate/nitrite transport system substrate-binding protein
VSGQNPATVHPLGPGGAAPEKRGVTLGIIPLTDCAPMVVARELGFFSRHGLDVTLSPEASWATIRDKVAVGALDGAHMLAGMPIAATLGIGARAQPMVTAFSIGLNGNAITVSNALFARMRELAPAALERRPVTARALRTLIDADRAQGRRPLTFATVFPVSTHNYQLRYWMAAAGIDPDRDVRLTVVPPPQMVEALAAGEVDGYCVGEPWNACAVARGLGRALITSYEIWNNGPEKVLGVTRDWAERHPATHIALVKALLEAAAWVDRPENRMEAADMLVSGGYVKAPRDGVMLSLLGMHRFDAGEFPVALPDFHVFHRYLANFPWRSHAIWLITQMQRWAQADAGLDAVGVARAVYRSDLFRLAAAELGVAAAPADMKPEGAHTGAWTLPSTAGPVTMGADRFFDGRRFDPGNPAGYLAGFEIRAEPAPGAAAGGA